MASVRDIYVGALSLKSNGKTEAEIREYIIERAHSNGLDITHGTGPTYEVIFGDGQRISFDGKEWRHRLK
jgi:hypothetical protein